MFGKLMKYEWQGCRGTLGTLAMINLGAGLLVGLVGVYLTGTEGQKSYVLPVVLLFLAMLAIGICAAGGFLYLIWRFYQSRFTDEGYLTFTLPVNNHQQLLAAVLNILRGTFLVFLAAVGAVFLAGTVYVIAFFPRDANWGELFRALWEYLPRLFESLTLSDFFPALAYILFHLFTGLLAGIIVLMVSVTTGAVLARKHRLLAMAAVYYGINLIQTVCMFSFGLSIHDGTWTYLLLMNLVTIAGGYALMHWLTSRKLNLS